MRALTFLLLLICAVLPATAEDDVPTQARHAYATFAGGQSQQDFMAALYGRVALDGIGGTWARLNGPAPKSGAETYGIDQQKACAGDLAISLSAPTPIQLRLETTRLKNNLQFAYTLVGGSTFAEHIDPLPYLDSIGLGPTAKGVTDAARALALSYVNGLVQIYRPSADIVVMTRDRSYPVVLARCPK